MRRPRRGRSSTWTSFSASDRHGRRCHGGDAGAGVPHAGDADWCSAPSPVGWRDAQYCKRRVWGVAPADDKIGTRRGGDATTPHGRGGTRPAALPTHRCGRRCGDQDVGGRRRGRIPPPRIYSAVVVTAAMPVLAYPTKGTLIGAQRLPQWGDGTPSTGSVAPGVGSWPPPVGRSGRGQWGGGHARGGTPGDALACDEGGTPLGRLPSRRWTARWATRRWGGARGDAPASEGGRHARGAELSSPTAGAVGDPPVRRCPWRRAIE